MSYIIDMKQKKNSHFANSYPKNIIFILLQNYDSFTLSQTSPGFSYLQYKTFENTVGKREIAYNEQFLLFPQCFLPVCRTFCHFHQI